MGYALMFVECCNCNKSFGCNPHKVPSLMLGGRRQPLCKECANRWNELHPENTRPIQEGAYSFFDENEL
jgi:hypothetical protein